MKKIEDKAEKYNKFLIIWDMYGLEAALNLDNMIQKKIEATLKEENISILESDPVWALNFYTMRARFNSHRNYEIYSINLPNGITSDDVIKMFENNPQHMAELIREKGVKFYGVDGQKPVITH